MAKWPLRGRDVTGDLVLPRFDCCACMLCGRVYCASCVRMCVHCVYGALSERMCGSLYV